MADWFAPYIGKPWAGVPNPPESFTCGELVRSVYRDLFGVEIVPIPVADARNLRSVLSAMVPGFFGFKPCDDPQDFDIVFLSRRAYMDHCGLAVMTADGLQILHCANPSGVIMSTPSELQHEHGYTVFRWYRHPEVAAQCQKSCF